MSESLRNDGRVWVPKRKEDCDKAPARFLKMPDYYLERKYPSFGNLARATFLHGRPRKFATKAARGPRQARVYLDFSDSIKRLGKDKIVERYGNLFTCMRKSRARTPSEFPCAFTRLSTTPWRHWVDYNLMTTVRGLFVLGEANFSITARIALAPAPDARLLTATSFCPTPSATISPRQSRPNQRRQREFKQARKHTQPDNRFALAQRQAHSAFLPSRAGQSTLEKCGMAATKRLKEALKKIQQIREEFWKNLTVTGQVEGINQSWSTPDASPISWSSRTAVPRCAAPQRILRRPFSHRIPGTRRRSKRDDQNFAYAAAWEYQGPDKAPVLHKEPLVYEEST